MIRKYLLLLLLALMGISCNGQRKNGTNHDRQPAPEAIAFNNRATAAYAQNPNSTKCVEEAVGLLDKAIAADADYGLAYAHKAEYLTRIGKTAQAMETLQAYLERNPADPYALLPMGILYEKTGDRKKAMDCYELADVNFKKRYEQDAKAADAVSRCLAVTLKEGSEKGKAVYQAERNKLAENAEELKANDAIVRTFTETPREQFIEAFWSK